MLECVEKIKSLNVVTAILSDQTNWLDEINQRTPFYQYFNFVFNSFTLKKSKKDTSVFRDVCSTMSFNTGEVLFVDDNSDNIERALNEGLKVIYFKDVESFEKEFLTLKEGI